MARLSFGYMVLLLTYAKIASANDLAAPDEINEKLNVNDESNSTYTGTTPTLEKYNVLQLVEQNEDANKFAKRSIEDSRRNRLYDNDYYNPPLPQTHPINRGEIPPHPYSFFSLWQPQQYQIDRPYYIPVLRGPGGSTIILPPQPLYFPPDNPPREYPPPNNSYLPPDNQNNLRPCSNITQTGTRFDNPVWDILSSPSPIPTRRPGGRSTTAPSLIHNINDGDTINESPNATPGTTTTTAAASTPKLPPSSCVWSIVSCCKSQSAEINYRCFEQLGCVGAFWDGSPCDSPTARAALESVQKYFAVQ